jgi:hypothetical protein
MVKNFQFSGFSVFWGEINGKIEGQVVKSEPWLIMTFGGVIYAVR